MYNVLDVNEVMLLACLKLHCWRGPPKLFVPQASDALKDLAEKQTCKCATCCIIREFTLDASCNVLEVPGLSKSDRHHVHFAWGKQRELIHSSTGPDEARVLVITKRFSTEDDMDRYKRIHDNETNEYKQVFFNVTSMYLLNASNQDKEASTLPPSSEASSSSTTASPTVHLDRAITECLNMNNVHIMIVVYAHLIKHNMVEKAIEAGFTFFKNLQDKPCQDKVNLAKDLLNKSMSHKTDPVSLWNCTMTMFRVNPSLNSYESAKSSFTGSKQEWSKVSNELLSPLKNDLEYVPVCIACLHLEELYNDAHQYVVGLSNQLPKKLFELYSHQVRSLSDKKIPEVRVKLLFEEHLMDVIRTPFDNSRSRDVDSIILLFARVGYLMFAREMMEAKLLHLSKTLKANSNSYDAFGKWLLVAKQVFDLIDTEDSYNHWCSLITKVKTDHKNKKLFVTRIDEMLKVLQARPVRNNAPTASL
ncbi:hypothetical protein AKO1_001893 [Acrasis kona]|uniref:Uncharacterized protein n=1 Tax=Acrasis kona TaxID=1008807 RepID=A0AAW2ZAF5_9EUKA